MVTLARQRDPGLPIYHADIRDWPLPRTYDLILAWDSIWHVPLADQPLVLEKLCRGLAEGGVLLFTTGGTDSPAAAHTRFRRHVANLADYVPHDLAFEST